MIYSDLEEYNIVGDTKAPLLRCFPFISKLKGGYIITTGQYMNYQTFSNLQFRPLLKNSFHSIHIDLRDTSGEKIPSVSLGITPACYETMKERTKSTNYNTPKNTVTFQVDFVNCANNNCFIVFKSAIRIIIIVRRKP